MIVCILNDLSFLHIYIYIYLWQQLLNNARDLALHCEHLCDIGRHVLSHANSRCADGPPYEIFCQRFHANLIIMILYAYFKF